MITLPERAVHVWQADLDRLDGEIAHSLSAQEQERARRIAADEVRRRWTAARGFLRALLGAYLDADPGSLRLTAAQAGKPALADEHSLRLRFNLSHSGSTAVCAVTRMCAVGVDVEIARRPRNAPAIARRLLGEEQAQRLMALPAGDREAELLRTWVAFEAEHKRTGFGIGHASRRVSGPCAWTAHLDVGPGAAAAVALALPPAELCHWQWPGRRP